jgi:hypothetical protein
MTLEIGSRRGFLIGALALMTAPAIVRADSIMKVASIDVFDTRCLIDYNIMDDQLVLRVDRSLRTLMRPTRIREIDIKAAKAIFGPHPIFIARPFDPVTGVDKQIYAMRRITTHELIRHGVVL